MERTWTSLLRLWSLSLFFLAMELSDFMQLWMNGSLGVVGGQISVVYGLSTFSPGCPQVGATGAQARVQLPQAVSLWL